MDSIAILVLVIVVVSIFVTIFLLLLRLRNARRASNNDSSGGVPDWQRQGQQAQTSVNPWGQSVQQPGAWGVPGSQQAGGWGTQGSSSPQQQPAWGSQPGSASPQDPWAQAQPVQQSQQQSPTTYGSGSSSGPAWGQSQQPADPWGTPAAQQEPTAFYGSNEADRTILRSTGPQGRLGVVRVEEGKEPGRVYEVRKDSLSIGRSRESDIFVEDLAVSRLHASIVNMGNGNYGLKDEGSANGTKVNGQLVTKYQTYPLQDGDKIQLGQTVLAWGQTWVLTNQSTDSWAVPSAVSQYLEAPSPQGRTDMCYSDVSFPSQTVVGQMEALRVAITRKAVNTWAVPLALERSSDDTQPMKVDAYVVVSPLDFDLESSNVQTITVFPNADSAPVLFKLVAKSEGGKTIALEFFQNAYYLGRAELETTVSQQAQVPHLVSAQALLEMSATQLPPDLTILFDRVPVGNDRHYYRYRLLSPIRELNLWFDEFRSPETNVTPQGFLEETFTQLNRMLSSDTPGEFFFGRLNSIGMSLYRRLFSDDFKHLYWNSLRNKVQNIVIISFEPWIPWELVRPFNHETNEADDGFLCEKFNLTRWLAGAGFPDIISLEQLGLIVSTSSLDSAKLEAEEIKKLLGSKARDIPSSSPSVYHLLRTNDLYGLHFACHGSFNKDNPDMSTLSLEDGTWLSPIDIDGDGLTFGKNRPLVFLNACETGQGGYALTGMGGWAEAFVGRARCSGLIGSIWKAKDESACKFAVAFYRNLLDGKTIAEAARLARLSIKQTGDPTWLSYTVYANPLAHLVIDRSQQRDNPILQPAG